MREVRKDQLLKSRCLPTNGAGNLRLRMSMQRHPPGGYPVENRSILAIVEKCAFSAPDIEWLTSGAVLSIGMPDMSPIELDDKSPVRQRESCVVSDSDDLRAHQSARRYGARSM
jgi:hypothetical protein